MLNNSRMPFDLGPFHDSPAVFSETLLSWCLSFRLESLLEHPEALERFLDATSQLQKLPLSKLDFMDLETFCIFANLYHCLLQHVLLASVNGPFVDETFLWSLYANELLRDWRRLVFFGRASILSHSRSHVTPRGAQGPMFYSTFVQAG